MSTQPCPICKAPQPEDLRYPNHLCEACVRRAVDERGRALAFGNTSLAGGFVATYVDTGAVHEGHRCWVDGVACWADEARFGGVVVQPYGEHDEFPNAYYERKK